MCIRSLWPNGQGVPLLRERLRVRVPPEIIYIYIYIYIFINGFVSLARTPRCGRGNPGSNPGQS